MLTNCRLLEETCNKYVSKLHNSIWNKINANHQYIHVNNIKLYKEPIFSGYFRLSRKIDTIIMALGSAYVNDKPIDIENYNLFQCIFQILPFILDIKDFNSHKKTKKIEVIDLYNNHRNPRVIEIYSFDILNNKPYDNDTYIISNLRKNYKYDNLKTYCQYYMDSIIQAASRKCAELDEIIQDEFVAYFYNMKEKIENDNNNDIDDNDILKLLEVLKPNNILQYYNPILQSNNKNILDYNINAYKF
jgi:hypothetical protein